MCTYTLEYAYTLGQDCEGDHCSGTATQPIEFEYDSTFIEVISLNLLSIAGPLYTEGTFTISSAKIIKPGENGGPDTIKDIDLPVERRKEFWRNKEKKWDIFYTFSFPLIDDSCNFSDEEIDPYGTEPLSDEQLLVVGTDANFQFETHSLEPEENGMIDEELVELDEDLTSVIYRPETNDFIEAPDGWELPRIDIPEQVSIPERFAEGLYEETEADREFKAEHGIDKNIKQVQAIVREEILELIESEEASFDQESVAAYLHAIESGDPAGLFDVLNLLSRDEDTLFRYVTLGQTSQELKDKWRNDVKNGTASKDTTEAFSKCNGTKDCAGVCNGGAYKDKGGCCTKGQRDCSGECFGNHVITSRYTKWGPKATCCLPGVDINCCPDSQKNCANACPSGKHVGKGLKLKNHKYMAGTGCCDPADDGCCPKGQKNPCNYLCHQDLCNTNNCGAYKFLGWEKKKNEWGGRNPKCCSTCCDDSEKNCAGQCPTRTGYDKWILSLKGVCCHKDDPGNVASGGCCEKSESHCGYCINKASAAEKKEIQKRWRPIKGGCIDCYSEDCTACNDSERNCRGQCPIHAEYSIWIYVKNRCCDKTNPIETDCCLDSERDCRGHCNGSANSFNRLGKDICCEGNDGLHCCNNPDACGYCPRHPDYSTYNAWEDGKCLKAT